MKNKSYRIEFRMKKSIFDMLNAICEVEKMTKSDVLRSIIERKFMENERYKEQYYKNLNGKS